jgi:hypothetical protein
MLMGILLLPGASLAANFLVTSSADSGAGSLREAVASANLTSSPDYIAFQGNLGTIFLQSNLTVDYPVFVDGRGPRL